MYNLATMNGLQNYRDALETEAQEAAEALFGTGEDLTNYDFEGEITARIETELNQIEDSTDDWGNPDYVVGQSEGEIETEFRETWLPTFKARLEELAEEKAGEEAEEE